MMIPLFKTGLKGQRMVGWSICNYTHMYALFFRVSGTLPTGQLSNIPWRRTGVKYTNNEAYFDVIEEVDAIIDKSGTTVTAEIQGYVSLFTCFTPPARLKPVSSATETR